MSMSKKENQVSKQSNHDAVAALQAIARAMPMTETPSKAERKAMRGVELRAPAALIALVLSMAEEEGGNVAGIPIDVSAARAAQAKASHLRVGAAAARAIARRLQDEALALMSGVAQDALSATTSLEALARTPAGRGLTAKAAELRAATAKRRRAKGTGKSAKGNSATPTVPSTPPANATQTSAAE